MELKFVLESILFAAQKPLNPRELREVLSTTAEQSTDEFVRALKKIKDEELVTLLEQLQQEHAEAARSYRLSCVAGSWQFVSEMQYAPWLITLIGQKPRPPRLSQPALETLAIIAYRQPITRAEVEQIRGVAIDGVMQTLLERGLVENAGRAEVIGRPMTYATTQLFLEYFGLRRLDDLPAADELRKVVVKRPEALVTAEVTTETPEQQNASAEVTQPTTSSAESPSEPSPSGESSQP